MRARAQIRTSVREHMHAHIHVPAHIHIPARGARAKKTHAQRGRAEGGGSCAALHVRSSGGTRTQDGALLCCNMRGTETSQLMVSIVSYKLVTYLAKVTTEVEVLRQFQR
eukprot:6203140-Pleurochrysis_carterae.AAC.2